MFYPSSLKSSSSTGFDMSLCAATADLSITGDFPLPSCPAKITYCNHTYTRVILNPKTDLFRTDPIELSLTIVQFIPGPSVPYVTHSLSSAPLSTSTTHLNQPTTQSKTKNVFEGSPGNLFIATADLRATGGLPLPARPKKIVYNGHIYSQASHGDKNDFINLFLTIVGTGIPKKDCPVNPHLQTFNPTSSDVSSMPSTNVFSDRPSSTRSYNVGTAPTRPRLNKGDINFLVS